ncbi:alpha/beta hydrolase [Gluconacetobacter aggeris]|uniref:Alpha/beta hydrolase n=1 Tax=Gluconacetobacter aggeris TaxID=1286186 RepID=A0A7W4NUR3_9PROT|nr:alpha/beta hydrolase [Gluconacetobacter aggeris]MBB2166857.1 alpha/beta hydrolase [Gluconacetobacter aggeris]
MTRFTTSDGVGLHYKDWGKGQPVLFSHGWPLSADMWDGQMLHLAENGFRAIAFDRRGFGRSDQPWQGHDYDRLADDIAELIAHLDLRDVILVGFSMGGGDVTRYIARHGSERVARLALLGAVTPLFMKTDDHPVGPEKSVFDGIRAGLRADRAQFLKDFSQVFYGINHGAQVSDGVLEQTLQIALQGSLKATIDCVTAFSETDFRPDMAKIDVPTLIIHGDDDQVVPLEATGALAAKMIPQATLTIYEGAPHGFVVTHADRVNADLLAFARG